MMSAAGPVLVHQPKQCQQPSDLGQGVADHARVTGADPFFTAVARLAASQARASMDKVMWAYQVVAMAWQASWKGTVRSTARAVRLRAWPAPKTCRASSIATSMV